MIKPPIRAVLRQHRVVISARGSSLSPRLQALQIQADAVISMHFYALQPI